LALAEAANEGPAAGPGMLAAMSAEAWPLPAGTAGWEAEAGAEAVADVSAETVSLSAPPPVCWEEGCWEDVCCEDACCGGVG
jgi:hypothetical protein